LFSVLYSFWVTNLVAFDGDALRKLAMQFLALAEKHGATAPLVIGHRMMGTSSLSMGDIAEGRLHYDRALALYAPAEHRSLAARFGQDPRVTILSFRSLALWLLGYPDTALADEDQALNDARAFGHAATLMYALFHISLPQTCCGNYGTAITLVDEVVHLADQKSAATWMAAGTSQRGCLFALANKASEAVPTIAWGINAWRATGSSFFMPMWLSHLARAHAELGQRDAAWCNVAEAMTAIRTTKERWWEPEVNRVAGEIALRSPLPDAAKAQSDFEHALTVARQQQAKSWELRAAMSLARLWRDQGKSQQARELLAPVYGWFTEGFDTRDLKEAKALLEELGS
jgi:predicted ATPase